MPAPMKINRGYNLFRMIPLIGGIALSCAAANDPGRSLLDLEPISAEQGFGKLELNHSVSGNPLTIAGKRYDHGLGTHARSALIYYLGGGYRRFEAWAGVDDEMTSFGKSSVVFKVFGDSRELFSSKVLRNGSPPCHIDVSVAGCEELSLVVTDGGDGIEDDHADWANPTLYGLVTTKTASTPPKAAYEVKSPLLQLALSGMGEVVGMAFGHSMKNVAVHGGTRLMGCQNTGEATVSKLPHGGMEFTRAVTNLDQQRCLITERFLPGSAGMAWEVDLRGEGEPWSAPIVTTLNWPEAGDKQFWTAWHDPLNTDAGEQRIWHDPLCGQPFSNRIWNYGELPGGNFRSGNITTLPLASVFLKDYHRGLTLVQSPEDVLLDMSLVTSQTGEVTLRRTKHRLGGGNVIHFHMDLVPHADDWRDAMAWMTARYPQYFEPPNPHVQAMAGMAAYTGEEKPVDVARMKRMDFRVLWKLSDDYAYMGMFLPPLVDPDARWERTSDSGDPPGYKPQWTSFRRLNDFAAYLRTNGFYLLNYFNTTEFGKGMKRIDVSPQQAQDSNLWQNASAYLAVRMPDAPVAPRHGAWQGGWAVDPGDPNYMEYLLEQAGRHLQMIPDSAGFCIDRADYLRNYNLGADDGVSWSGQKARSLVVSWRRFMDRLGPMVHQQDKVIFCNLLDPRLDLTRHLDGVYHEFGYEPTVANGAALLCVNKPLLVWTRNGDILSDDFFQRYLYLGAFPTAPYPLNNHCIQPSPERDQWYYDYGPLFGVLHGKRWILKTHCVEIANNDAKANLFQVDGGWAAPVVFGGKHSAADLFIRGVPDFSSKLRCEALYPGEIKPVAVPVVFRHGAAEVRVPLKRGCAMLKFISSPAHASGGAGAKSI